jgi:hypothetical protein
MICKERDKGKHPTHDKLSEAEARAEKQMAFYLKRAFRDDSEAWVFNDLRYQADDDDAAQIDHLVLHRSGFILVESKSVTYATTAGRFGLRSCQTGFWGLSNLRRSGW